MENRHYNNVAYSGQNGVWFVERRALVLWTSETNADVYVGIEKVGEFSVFDAEQSPAETFRHQGCHWAMSHEPYVL